MEPDIPALPGRDEIRRYNLDRLNQALRRPGMWGGEVTIRLFLDAVAFVDGGHEEWGREHDDLRARAAFTSVGVRGAFAAILPRYADTDAAVASVYAEIAWRHGWLTVDRTLPDQEHRQLSADSGRWGARDFQLDEIQAELGPPSVLFGGHNPRYGKTLAYAPTDRDSGLVCLHFAGTYDWTAPDPQPETQPVLVAVRYGGGAFADTFTFTPMGDAYRDNGEM
ncbi:hypothetical protein ACWEOO_15210 [Kribbella sp. NPDC004138]